MIIIKVKTQKTSITAEANGLITSGMVGASVNVQYDESWNGLSKTIFFRSGEIVRYIRGNATNAIVPWEVLRVPGKKLEIGIEGRDNDGNVIMPTVWATVGTIRQGAQGDIPAAPNPESGTVTGEGATIDDSETSLSKVWSSKKTSDTIKVANNSIDDIKIGYDGKIYDTAGDAVRGQVGAIESAFDVEKTIGNNILDPSNSESGGFSQSPVVGEEVGTTSNADYIRTKIAVPIPTGTKKLYVRTNVEDSSASGNVLLYFLKADGTYIKRNITSFKNIAGSENGYYTSDTILSSYTHFLVMITGVSSGRNFSELCISSTLLDSFEPFEVVERSRTLKPSALPGKIAPTNGKKMLVFGDSITETAKMDNDGGNYNPDFRMNWPVIAQEMLQLDSIRNYAKAGATARDTGYERNEQGELVPKDESVVYRKNLSEQVDLAISDTHYTDTPDIIVISIGTNDSAAIESKPDESRDTYEEAMAIASLDDFTYETRATMHKALRYAMWKLKVKYPVAKCFIATPLQREAFEIPKYTRDAIVAMGNRYGFKVIDAFSESGIIRETCEPRFLPDGLHPSGDAGISYEGVAMQAELYASVILSTYLSKEYTTEVRNDA